MKQGRSLQDFAALLEHQNEIKKDYIVTKEQWEMTDTGRILINTNEGVKFMTPNKIMDSQIAEYYKIPKPYYDRMASEDETLLSQNVNTWRLMNGTHPRMIRTLGGTARAFLSNKFLRMDNYDFATLILEHAADNGMSVQSCEITDAKMYIKAIFPNIQRALRKTGQILTIGFVGSNSEVGKGARSIAPFTVNLACLNGMTHMNFGESKHHLGIAQFDDTFKDDTMKADDEASRLKIRDIVNNCASDYMLEKIVAAIDEADEVPFAKGSNLVEALDNFSKRRGINEEEKGNILTHLIEGGNLSFWGLSSAITRSAQDVEDYDRATDLEELGWNTVEEAKSGLVYVPA